MPRTFVISDLHLSHAKIIEFAGRPFSNVKEMNEALVSNWNDVVRDDDIVYHLGDLYFHNDELPAAPYVRQLKGKKHAILGNHDSGTDHTIFSNFNSIELMKKMKKPGLILSHVPFHPTELVGFDKEYRQVHGHIHEKCYFDPRYINVSVERIGYKPLDLEEIIDGRFRYDSLLSHEEV